MLKGTHLPVTLKEIQVGYLNSPYFKDVYLYLAQNKLPSHKAAIRRTDISVERHLLLDSLLSELNTTPEKESADLSLPESFVDRRFTLYHSSIFGGHQGVIKTYLTVKKFSYQT